MGIGGLKLTASLVVAASLSLAESEAQQDTIKVLCTEGEVDGFVGSGVSDSTQDLVQAFRDKESFTVVDSVEAADIVVIVVAREHLFESSFGGNRRNVNVVYAVLRAGEYGVRFQGRSTFNWRGAAGDVADQVEKWVEENHETLMVLRESGESTEDSVGDSMPEAEEDEESEETLQAEITVGMTTDEVREILGEAKKQVSFGGKTLWDYDGFQVVFEEGKVVDVKF